MGREKTPIPGKACRSQEPGILRNENSSIPGKRDSRKINKRLAGNFFGKKLIPVPGNLKGNLGSAQKLFGLDTGD